MRRRGVPRQLGRATLVMMVKSTDIGKLDDLTQFWRLDGTRVRSVHVQGAVNPPWHCQVDGARRGDEIMAA